MMMVFNNRNIYDISVTMLHSKQSNVNIVEQMTKLVFSLIFQTFI